MIRLRSLKVVAPAALMAGVLVLGEVSQAMAEGFLVAEENHMTDLVNQHRADHRLGSLRQDAALQMVARRQAQRMAAAGYIYHNADLAREASGAIPDWLRLGENVGTGGDVVSVEDAFLASPTHHANIDSDYSVIGLGAVAAGNGRMFFTQNFAFGPGPPPAPAAPTPSASSGARAAPAAPCRGRRCPRPPRRRAPRARRARVRGVVLVRAAGPDDVRGGGSVTLPDAIGGMLGHAGDKLVFWN